MPDSFVSFEIIYFTFFLWESWSARRAFVQLRSQRDSLLFLSGDKLEDKNYRVQLCGLESTNPPTSRLRFLPCGEKRFLFFLRESNQFLKRGEAFSVVETIAFSNMKFDSTQDNPCWQVKSAFWKTSHRQFCSTMWWFFFIIGNLKHDDQIAQASKYHKMCNLYMKKRSNVYWDLQNGVTFDAICRSRSALWHEAFGEIWCCSWRSP